MRQAFLNESGAALIARYAQLGDPLFTPDGFRAYVEDLIERMTNPYLGDTVARATRDPLRKLGYSDRLFGAMRLCLSQGVQPVCLAAGALAGLAAVRADGGTAPELRRNGASFAEQLRVLWGEAPTADERLTIASLLQRAQDKWDLASDIT